MAASDYITVDHLKAVLRVKDNYYDEFLALAISAASAQIDEHCDDKFWLDEVAAPMLFKPTSPQVIWTPSFASTEGTVIELDIDNDGVFERTLDASEWQPAPVNRRPGWPYKRIETLGSVYLPGVWPPFWQYAAGPYGEVYNVEGYPQSRRARIRITARWGWPEVPWQVRQAAQILAVEAFKSKDMTGGAAGTEGVTQRSGWGRRAGMGVSPFNPQAKALLCSLRDPVLA